MFRYTDERQLAVRHEEEGWVLPVDVTEGRSYMKYKKWLDEGNVTLPHVRSSDEEIMAGIRVMRNDRLAETDWTQMPGAVSAEAKANWDTYRQELRDLPSTIADPAAWSDEDNWPVKPE